MSAKYKFSALMDDLGVIYDRSISVDQKRLYWEDLEHLPIEVIEQAIKSHRRDPDRGRFFPKPADILHRCRDPRLIHPAPDAAWAIALESLDEAASVVLTEQIGQARAAALPVWLEGDRIGARMAFRAAYEQILATTKGGPVWQFSPGHDPDRRAEAAERAVQLGLLSQSAANEFLPAPEPTHDGRAIAGLLTGDTSNVVGINERVRAHLAEVRAAIAKPKKSDDQRTASEVNASRRQDIEAAKEKALADLEKLEQEKTA